MTESTTQPTQGLYNEAFEKDSCGIGFIANLKGKKTHSSISDALTILENMEHRGACGCEENTGDGAGILIQIPHEFLFQECSKLGFILPASGKYGVGVVFFSKDKNIQEQSREILLRAAEKLGLDILGFRKVPVNTSGIGETALSVEPDMEQVFVACPDNITEQDDFERKLYVLRNFATHTVYSTVKKDSVGFYIASLSSKTIVYKGQLTSHQVRTYFKDLNDKRVVSAFGLIHSRFATNTFPSWRLAQPFRFIAHNGEINTIQGNINWLKTSEYSFVTPYFTKEELDLLLPVIPGAQSDSASLDNMIELLTFCGRSLPHVMMMLIPEAWDNDDMMDAERKAFYEFHASFMEPWDGPASISFTDGKIIGATLDRNGLRPSRYCITNDHRVIMASESGVLPVPAEIVIEKGRLQPGKMFIVDIEEGRVVSDDELKKKICSQKPYGEWLSQHKITLEDLPAPRVMFTHLEPEQVLKYQKVFGYTTEDLETIIAPMALDSKEPIGSMGTDAPLAVLSNKPQHLCNYFKQLFAQVTNPPIDPIRERNVMSLSSFVGNHGNILTEDSINCHTVVLPAPVINHFDLERIRSIDTGLFQSKTLQSYFKADGKPGSLKKGLDRLCRYAVDAVEDGFEVLIISDRAIDSEHAPIPSLLATSAVHHHLIRKGYRGKVGLIIEAGDVWEVHHFACLIAFGATAVNPYLALSTVRIMKETGALQSEMAVQQLRLNYIEAVNTGLLKVLSKMGISTIQSYQGAQIFEIIGLSSQVVERYFTGATSRIEGLDLDDIAEEVLTHHRFAFSKKELPGSRLNAGGVYKWNRKGEFHLFNPQTIHLLQHSVRTDDYSVFKKYSNLINHQEEKACTLRSLFDFKKNRKSIPLEEVESAENIYKRFATGAMSFGSISWEAHTTLAVAMNRIGGKSNTGEGGEDEARYEPMPNGDSMRSSIKQIASGRFGVTSLYLSEADELQIKMSQGAKPGEGGQLPGFKVDEWIGRVRHSTPGVGLISPPPHHDIYSIEDLAQLIFDLKNANRSANISVKLVSKSGVGTIAAGVAKAKADAILISGYDGGTGASPISSIRHAGLPWELGLAETHQTLVRNRLRGRVILQADGQMKSGRDIAIATLLGAEEWGVATAALVAEGCIMMRKCHLNTCPVGVATQDPELRKMFTGQPEHIINLFKFITQELREIMAELGFRTVNEMIGQSDCLTMRDNITHRKQKKVNLSAILYKSPDSENTPLYKQETQDHGLTGALDFSLLKIAEPALSEGKKLNAEFSIKNTDRAVGAILSNEITKKYRKAGLPDDTIHLKFTGSAGQSFGVFAANGLTLEIEGDANDYFGKGLSGAKLIIYPDRKAGFVPEQNIIIGNVSFYGATSGEAYIRGKAGERFCVRNSGAVTVVEGVGDHGCEYMTGGTALILGETGKNFAAGMSGGFAFIYDSKQTFKKMCNTEMVWLESPDEDDMLLMKRLLQNHFNYTGSSVANLILKDFDEQMKHFIKVFPKDYKAVLSVKKEKAKVV